LTFIESRAVAVASRGLGAPLGRSTPLRRSTPPAVPRRPTVRYYWNRAFRSRLQKEATMDYKLELVAVPVSDVDRAKAFYADKVGFNADHDHTVNEDIRFVQLTPPGSSCSIAIGKGVTEAAPGSVVGLQLVVSNVDDARQELVERGVDASPVQVFPWGKFVFFSDPDGNKWAVQEITR
jgi:predicted enzyme related to lactoylglutathione lyase